MNAHRTDIRSRTRRYQAAALGLGAAAVGVAALPLAKAFGPGEMPTVAPVETTAPPSSGRQASATDVSSAAEVLKGLLGWSAEKVVEAPKPDATAAPAPAPAPAHAEWAYLGSVITPANRHALVRIDQSQFMLKAGSEHEGTKLVEVDPRFIMLEAKGERRRVDLQARVSAFPTDPPRRGVSRAGAMPAPVAMNQNGIVKPMTPATFEGAKMMAKSASVAQPPPARTPPAGEGRFTREIAEKLSKLASDPGMKPEERRKMFSEYGLDGLSMDEAMDRFRGMGINPDEHPGIIETLKHSGGKGGG